MYQFASSTSRAVVTVLPRSFANKQDKPGALSAVDIAEKLQLHELKNVTYHILEGSALPKDDDTFDDSVKRGACSQ